MNPEVEIKWKFSMEARNQFGKGEQEMGSVWGDEVGLCYGLNYKVRSPFRGFAFLSE